MEPRIEYITDKKLIGKRITTSFSNNRTFELWHSFMPRKKEIKNSISDDLYSLQVFSPLPDFSNFNPDAQFEKWAAIEVSDFDSIPDQMEAFRLTGGLYAVFIHHGSSSAGERTFQYIFGTWLPASGYTLDDRPHFEVMGNKYKNDDPNSEEEVWIPIRAKK